jgi:hypothetical protein
LRGILILSTPDRARDRLESCVYRLYIEPVHDGFEWDEDKADANSKTHGISFDEAAEFFYDSNRVEELDEGHSEDEGL